MKEYILFISLFKIKKIISNNFLNFKFFALTHVTQQVGHHPAKQKVTCSIPSQGMCLGCGFGPWLGYVQEATDQCLSLISMFLFLPFSLSSPLSNRQRNLNSLKCKLYFYLQFSAFLLLGKILACLFLAHSVICSIIILHLYLSMYYVYIYTCICLADP